ncbi:MAG: hypothetical protein RIB84_00575 [Sneathiellaceae bacterium]
MDHHAHRNIVWLPSTGRLAPLGKRTVSVRARAMIRRIAIAAAGLPLTACREILAWRRSRQALYDLRHADPRLLRDIGLDHADLWHAVRHGRDRPATGLHGGQRHR